MFKDWCQSTVGPVKAQFTLAPMLYNFSHAQLSMEFIMPINIKTSTIVGILTFISMINTISESLKAREYFFQHFRFYEQLGFHFSVVLSMNIVLSSRGLDSDNRVKLRTVKIPSRLGDSTV